MSKPEPKLVRAVITSAGTFVLPPQTKAYGADAAGTVYADGMALTPVHCTGCMCQPTSWRSSCRWCGREYDQVSRYDNDCCSDDCYREGAPWT